LSASLTKSHPINSAKYTAIRPTFRSFCSVFSSKVCETRSGKN
jgi:hypothetical protein